MIGDKEFIGYKCGICKGSKSKYYKKFNIWIYKHFEKYHKGEKINLIRRYK